MNIITYYSSNKDIQSKHFATLSDDFNMLGFKNTVIDSKDSLKNYDASQIFTEQLTIVDIYLVQDFLKKVSSKLHVGTKYIKVFIIVDNYSKDEDQWMLPVSFEALKKKKSYYLSNNYFYYLSKNGYASFEDTIIDLLNNVSNSFNSLFVAKVKQAQKSNKDFNLDKKAIKEIEASLL